MPSLVSLSYDMRHVRKCCFTQWYICCSTYTILSFLAYYNIILLTQISNQYKTPDLQGKTSPQLRKRIKNLRPKQTFPFEAMAVADSNSTLRKYNQLHW